MPVLDIDTVQTLEYFQLLRHTKYQHTWKKYCCNELSHLCQGIGTAPSGAGPHIKCTNTVFIVNYEDIPTDRLKEVTYTKVVCKLNTHKNDPNRMRIAIIRN